MNEGLHGPWKKLERERDRKSGVKRKKKEEKEVGDWGGFVLPNSPREVAAKVDFAA